MAKGLFFLAALVSFLAPGSFAREESLFARVTVYWPGEGASCACFNGARLRAGHCAVDPKKIPYGSKVYFPDGPCLAVDTGPAVVNRKAARLSGRNSRQRNALVIDRYFESKEKALAWERTHPHFMSVRVVSGRASPRSDLRPMKPEPTNTIDMAETIVAPPIAQTAPPPLAMPRPEVFLAAATVFRTPPRSRIGVPPSYHRRRFDADGTDEMSVPPPTCTIRPLKRLRAAYQQLRNIDNCRVCSVRCLQRRSYDFVKTPINGRGDGIFD